MEMEDDGLQSRTTSLNQSNLDIVPGSLGEQMDEDLYEDAGDLDFTNYSSNIFLARLPQYLWKTWSDSDDEQDVKIGTIRVEGSLESPEAASLLTSCLFFPLINGLVDEPHAILQQYPYTMCSQRIQPTGHE